MRTMFASLTAGVALSLVACSGGGIPTVTPIATPSAASNPNPTPTPAAGPTATAMPAATGNAPTFETVTTHAGAQSVLVDSSSHHTMYYVDGDSPPGTACTAASLCTTIWPPMTPTSGSQGAGNLTIVTRADGGQQWAYKGHALYHFGSDSGADQDNGEYGPWHPAAQ